MQKIFRTFKKKYYISINKTRFRDKLTRQLLSYI